MEVKRGQVWWWSCYDHDRNHIQRGHRPVVVVSNDICNNASGVITVIPFTNGCRKPFPQQVPVVLPTGISTALGDQITTIPVEELEEYYCTLRDFQMVQIDNAIRIQLGFMDSSSHFYSWKEGSNGSD